MALSSDRGTYSTRRPYILSRFTGWNDDKIGSVAIGPEVAIQNSRSRLSVTLCPADNCGPRPVPKEYAGATILEVNKLRDRFCSD